MLRKLYLILFSRKKKTLLLLKERMRYAIILFVLKIIFKLKNVFHNSCLIILKFNKKKFAFFYTRQHFNKIIFNFIGSDTWGAGSVVWPSTNPAGNFWTGLDPTSTERGTPSSLNSLLPENLLGNELN